MSVGLSEPENLIPVNGVRLSAGHAGIKKNSVKNDLVLIELCAQASVAAVFTRNKFCAAPVIIARRHLEQGTPIRYLLINSGNANAGTGTQGLESAIKTCQAVASAANIAQESVLPFSTGVIGCQLADQKISAVIPALFNTLAEDHWLDAARAIMTTDTVPKALSRQVSIDGHSITITGMCKGSGMIKPDMATMLGYVATDAVISRDELQACLKQAVDVSFNCITVDGDTSTNDASILIATGTSAVRVDRHQTEFMQALVAVFQHLAQSIIRDGEGATKFIEICIEQAQTLQDARELAYTIAHSPLVKTALFASDANWGRILAAIGRAPVSALEIDRVDLFLGDVCLLEKGLPHADYTEQKGQQVMQQQDITIRVNLHLGLESATLWTTDLSYDYVKINAEYRS